MFQELIQLARSIKQELKLKGEEDTTKDGLFTVMEVACLGAAVLLQLL